MATNGYYDTTALSSTTVAPYDPLEALKAPTVEKSPEMIHVYYDGEMKAITEAFNHKLRSDAEEAIEAMMAVRKVIQCYGCDNFVLDGTLTAFETNVEGEQPFCYECVAGIEKRSAPPTVPYFNELDWSKLFGGSNVSNFKIPWTLTYGMNTSPVNSVPSSHSHQLFEGASHTSMAIA